VKYTKLFYEAAPSPSRGLTVLHQTPKLCNWRGENRVEKGWIKRQARSKGRDEEGYITLLVLPRNTFYSTKMLKKCHLIQNQSFTMCRNRQL